MSRLEEYRDALATVNRLTDDLARVIRRGYPKVTREGSQGEEDELLAKLLPEPFGLYMDIGAGDPVQCSNTWAFYQRGWCGILVEPLEECWYALMRQRPRDRLYPVACLDKPGVAQLYVDGSVSSLRDDWSLDHKDMRIVEVESVSSILEKASLTNSISLDLLSIDVEGSERAVLEGVPWHIWRPKVIVIEFVKYHPEHVGPDISYEWDELLRDQGYETFGTQTTQINRIYTLRKS